MKEKLRTLFQQKFNPKDYRKTVLENLLHAQQLLNEPQFLEETNDGDRIYGLGYLTDADGKQIGLYYTDVVSGDVCRKRVGFRQMMKSYVKYGADAAIAVFADKEHWRLSYMSDLKGGETSAKRFSYILGDPNGQYNTPVNRLAQLGTQVPRLRLKDIFEAFSVETLSKEFFDKYHQHYDHIVDELAKQGKIGAQYHDYVKKMMGRIIFLHFLQKKGWLNGNQYFLRDLYFMSSYQADFLEQVLEPLFFGIFNTETTQRERLFADEHWDKKLLEEWKSLPYLNGGLFERDEVDKLHIKLPASLYEDLFTFLASYNFTVDENDPDDAEVGVDPEMLGKIFESLLEDNKAKGAFYTPKEIVRYMCKESLIAYLDNKFQPSDITDNVPKGHNLNNPTQESEKLSQCGDSNNREKCVSETRDLKSSIRAFVETHEMQPELEPYRDILDAALRNVKICDPAIGSGAFPMGLLNELWRCREAIEETASRVDLKKQIIENNIYGVDIERGAIDIARLRFWLSIVVDAEEPEPLPNFDYKFMQGNSLIESYKGIDLSRISNRLPGGQSKSTQLLLGLDSDFSKKNLQRLMRDYFSVTDHKQKASMRQAINDEVKRLITDFIGGTASDLEKLDPSANQDFFLWHTWFKDIFDNGGFDIIIANPPYIDSETMVVTMPDVRQYYSEKFKTAKGNWDIFVVFIEHGLNISAKGGVFSFIVPNKLIAAKYATQIREEIEKNCIIAIRDYSRVDVFANASVYPCTIIGTKTKQDNNMIFAEMSSKDCISKYNVIPQATFNSCKYWDVFFNESHTVDIIKKYLSEKAISEYSNISVTAAATVSEAYQLKEIMFDADCLKSNCLQVVNTGTIDPYSNLWGVYPMQYIKNKYLYPQVAASDLKQMNGNRLIQAKHSKIIVAGMSKRIEAILDGGNTLAGKSTTIVLCDDISLLKYILGIINSKLSTYCLSIIFNSLKMAGGFMNVATREVQSMTIPDVVDKAKYSVIELVDKILNSKRTSPVADTSDLEREIDQHVYALYNLTPEEIAIIEQN